MKTAAELGIEPEMHEALTWVRGHLAAGNLTHVLGDPYVVPAVGNGFNYGTTCSANNGCGTSGCIGGWVMIRMAGIQVNARGVYDVSAKQAHAFGTILRDEFDARHMASDYRHPIGLKDLFFAPLGILEFEQEVYDRITPTNAVKAIDNYLTTGDPDWKDVVSDIL